MAPHSPVSATLEALVSAFDPSVPIARASTPPASWYTDPAIFELERRTTFSRHWQPVARASALAAVGSYVSGCSAGEPWVVVRAADGLRAFSNVCRHKGREVVTGSGCAAELTCGYHAWTYDLDGRLRKAPRMGGIEGFERDAMGLPRLGVDVWGPWVFIHQDPDAAPVASAHPELDALLAASGWDALTFAGRATWDIACNWKVYVDNYLDGGYHVPHMHPTLDAQLDMASYRTELFGASSVQSCLPSQVRDERIDFRATARIGERALYAWLHPAFMINRYGPCLDTNLVIPVGPDRCRVEYEFFFANSDSPEAREFIEQSMDQSAVTQREDIEICESVQRGLGSSRYDRGRYAPRVEHGEHHFHRLLAADYASFVG